MNAVANKAPAAKLNKCWVKRPNTARASKAASSTLPTPALSVPAMVAHKVMFIGSQPKPCCLNQASMRVHPSCAAASR